MVFSYLFFLASAFLFFYAFKLFFAKSDKNLKLLSATFCSLALWNAIYCFTYSPFLSKEVSLFLFNMSHSLELLTCFMMMFSLLNRLYSPSFLRSKAFFYSNLGLAGIYFTFTFFIPEYVDVMQTQYGWEGVAVENNILGLFHQFLLVIYAALTISSLFGTIQKTEKETDNTKLRQLLYILIGIIALQFIFRYILPLFDLSSFPNINALFISLLSIAIYYFFNFDDADQKIHYHKYLPEIINSALFVCAIDGKILENNKTAKIFFNRSEEYFKSKNIKTFLIEHSILDKLHQTGEVSRQNTEIFTGDHKIPANIDAKTICDDNNIPLYSIWIIEDKRYVSRTVEALKIAKNKAEEAEKLKSAFLANLSHEIRTPMNAIMGFLTLINNNPDLSAEKKEEYLQHINKGGEDLISLIDDMIDLAMLESGQIKIDPVSFELNEFLESVYQEYLYKKNNLDKKYLPFKLSLPQEFNKLTVAASRNRLKKVLEKLLDNALKFTEEGYIEMGYTVDHSTTSVITFYVKDTGLGIPYEKRDFIFDRFTKIERDGEKLFGGTGLGLSIAKSIVSLFGGEIWVETKTNAGSVFYFSYPCKYQTDIVQISPPKPKSLSGFADCKFLIAEDIDINFIFLEEVIMATGATIVRAHNGEEAVELYKTEKPDLILMDIIMPKKDGYQATAEIRKLDEKIPIIAQTACAMPEEKELYYSEKFTDYIEKPINPAILYEKIRNALNM